MKKIISFYVFFILSFICTAQDFDTNGPMGKCLFPEDENGNILFTGIISAEYGADTLKMLAYEFLVDINRQEFVEINDIHTDFSRVTGHPVMRVGTDTLHLYKIGAGGEVSYAKTEIEFDLTIDIRDRRFRYTLTNFHTDRWRIRGDAEGDGPSNKIHWQRVNSIKKNFDGRPQKRDAMIKEEEESYLAEYNTVLLFIEKLEHFADKMSDF